MRNQSNSSGPGWAVIQGGSWLTRESNISQSSSVASTVLEHSPDGQRHMTKTAQGLNPILASKPMLVTLWILWPFDSQV